LQRLQRPPKRIVQEHRLNEVYRKRKDEERRRRMDEAAEEVARVDAVLRSPVSDESLEEEEVEIGDVEVRLYDIYVYESNIWPRFTNCHEFMHKI
jgi:hypothetical protein